MGYQQGILYIATGEQHVQEALDSANASKPYACEHPFVLVTDCVSQANAANVFDQVLSHSNAIGSYRDKISPLLRLPFAQTLFLDSDARLTAPVSALFSALGTAHLAAAHSPVRLPSGWRDESVPSLFPELNSGVLLLRRGRLQRRLIRRWLRLYDKLHFRFAQTWDQASLRSVVWRMTQQNKLRLATLPAEANFRTTKPWVAGKGLAVHVLHGRVPPDEREALMNYLNTDIGRFRTWAEWFQREPQSRLALRIGEQSTNPSGT